MKKINPNNINFSSMNDGENADLKKRIFDTINKDKRSNKKVGYQSLMAACFVGCMGLGLYYYNANAEKDSITDFVNSTDLKNVEQTSNEVVLTLGKGNDLKIKEDVATINYSHSGKNVTIGSGQSFNQNIVDNDKAVFNTLWVPYGKRSTLTLSDGSVVWLNSGSKLIYPIVFSEDKREVYIEGEAIFEVTHNNEKPFYVISDNQVVKVLGTVFGVTNYPDENSTNTILKSGSVQISYQNIKTATSHADKMKISPGTKASFDKSTKSIVSEKVDVDNYFSWKDGFLMFKNNNLSYIMKRISRYYNVVIDIENNDLATETFSGYLDLNDDMISVIKSISESTNMEYLETEHKMIIK